MAVDNITTFPNFAPKPARKCGKPFVDIEGETYHRLTVLGYAGSRNGFGHWHCRCECGNIITRKSNALRTGNTKSCGCLPKDKPSRLSHGRVYTPEYNAYHSAKWRCTSKKYHNYEIYGGRGIEFRFNSFEDFYAEIGDKPSPQHSLDRIDVNSHYEKGNVRWATAAEQLRNRTDNVFITANGETLCQSDWSKRLGSNSRVILLRRQHQWCDACAVTIPIDGGTCPHR